MRLGGHLPDSLLGARLWRRKKRTSALCCPHRWSTSNILSPSPTARSASGIHKHVTVLRCEEETHPQCQYLKNVGQECTCCLLCESCPTMFILSVPSASNWSTIMRNWVEQWPQGKQLCCVVKYSGWYWAKGLISHSSNIFFNLLKTISLHKWTDKLQSSRGQWSYLS